MKVYFIKADYGNGSYDEYIVSAESKEDAEKKISKLCGGAFYIGIEEIDISIPYLVSMDVNNRYR